MFVTLDGIVTDVNPLQPRNAHDPMCVTVVGMSIELICLHPSKALSAISVAFTGMVTVVMFS